MLGDIEPVDSELIPSHTKYGGETWLFFIGPPLLPRFRVVDLPEVQIVHRSLLISHKDVEGKQVDWWKSPPAQNLKKGRQPVSTHVGHRRRRVDVRHVEDGRETTTLERDPSAVRVVTEETRTSSAV